MATSAEIKSNNNTLIRIKTTAKSITKSNVADQLDASIDYTIQETALKQATLISGTNIKTVNGNSILGSGNLVISGGGATKTSGAITLSATPTVLPYDANSCSFTGGIAYLPATTEINKEIYVIATANNIEIRANAANTNRMFVTFNTFVSNVILTTNQMYRFIYIDFGGYWKAELI